jgi:agmatinase
MKTTIKPLCFGEPGWQAGSMETARAVILPLCHEQGASYGRGSGQGPLHILEASQQLEALDDQTLTDWTRPGLFTLAPLFPGKKPRQAVERMQEAASTVLEAGKFLLSLGGDHAISLGPIMAAAQRFADLGVLQIDAHLDLRETWKKSRYNHACVMRRVVEDAGRPLVQVGIRAFCAEEAAFAAQKGLRPFYAHSIDGLDSAWINAVVAALPERVYLTVDLDGLDPSVIPGTGTPEPGGLSFGQVAALIAHLGRHRHVVAADINELVKIPGQQVSEYTAAKLGAKIIAFCTPER